MLKQERKYLDDKDKRVKMNITIPLELKKVLEKEVRNKSRFIEEAVISKLKSLASKDIDDDKFFSLLVDRSLSSWYDKEENEAWKDL